MSNDQTMKVHKGWTADKVILEEAEEILKYFEWDALLPTPGNSFLVPEDPGVYIFSTKIDIDGYVFRNPFYIGESNYSIRDRYKVHIYRDEWEKMLETYGNKFTYSYYLLDEKDAHKSVDLEDNLIRCFGAKLNVKNSKKRRD